MVDALDSPYTAEEEDARAFIRTFLDKALEPHYEKFIGNLDYDRAFWRQAGQAGLLGPTVPEALGGPGMSQIVSVVISQELGRSIGAATIGSSIAADLATHIMVDDGAPWMREKYLPGIMAGEIPQCVAMTEPDTGSDLTAITTKAIRDGDDYVVNGSKIYISNANKAKLIYLVAKTDPTKRGRGMSLLLIDSDTPGITVRPLRTLGGDAYDVAELHFDNVRVPVANRIGEEGEAMKVLMKTLMLDRLQVSARALGEAELAYGLAVEHVKTRETWGTRVIDYQNTQFTLADMKTEIEVGRSFLHDGVRRMRNDTLTHASAAMIKLWIPAMSGRVIDKALQLFGGSGFMDEFPISRLYRVNRVHRLYVGTDEMMKITIHRALEE